MTEKEFLYSAERIIYEEIAKNTNLLLGKNKTSSLSTGLFLKLPITLAVEQIDSDLPKVNKDLESLMPSFLAYTLVGNSTQVFFKFLYNTESDLTNINRNLHRFGTFLAFVYIHELNHIIRKHNTTSYENMMKRIAGDILDPHTLINIAEDYAINYSIKDLFMASSRLSTKWNEIEAIGLYDHTYHTDKLSDIEILKDLLDKNPPQTIQLSNLVKSVTFDGMTTNQPTEEALQDSSEASEDTNTSKTATTSDDMDQALGDLSDALKDIISSNTKGTAAGDLFNDIFGSIKVEIGWFKKIKASFKRQVYYMTHDYFSSWNNINNTFRHIYMSPKKYYMDSKLNIILSIDQSGSVATEELQKLLYLFEESSKQINSLTVIIHDVGIVKEFELSNDYDIKSNPQFIQALSTRYSSGGTSHASVFKRVDELITDPATTIYMSYSDNYSDIESEWRKYPKLHKIVAYFVCTINNPVHTKNGINITLV
jgi:hypothetical protein